MAEPLNEPDVVQPNIVVNTAHYFLKCEKYKVRDDMIKWCRNEAVKAGFTLVIGKSDNGSYRRKKFFVLGCSRGDAYKETKRKLKKEDTATRKFNCPFRLRGYFLASQEWNLSVVCGEHNHELAKNLEGHTLAGRLKPEEKECVHELTRNLVPPKNILSTLKGRNPESKTNVKQIYNARQRFKKDVRGDLSELQQLMKCCESHKYFYKCRTVDDSTTVQDIFWAHPESVKLFNTFPTVLMLDSMYKTNKYKMPLFEMVGVTSTEESYNVGFAYIANEKEDDFTWALDTCVSLLKSKDTVPKVIVTDRDKSLMNAVAKERLKSSDYSMKLQIRDQLRQIAYPEITSLTPPVKQLDTKGAKKRGRSSKCNSSTTRSPSYWEYIDAQYPDSQTSQSQPSKPKRKTARIGTLSPNAIPGRSIRYIEYMPPFMHSHIEDIIDVKGDGHCGFRVAAEYLNKGEDCQGLIRHKLIRELTMFRKEYLNIYGTEKRLQYILDGLYPPKVMPKSGIAPPEKWFMFPDMGHILATAYNRIVVELTKHQIGHSETFFPLRGRPLLDPSSRIMCIGMVPNHFVYVKLKAGCPLPPTCKEWKTHRASEAETWEDTFLDRMAEFDELMKNEKGEMDTNEDDPVILS
ncbi:hypothetical protein TSUD_230790 [Trifolium subterraneum]|nr:hypothetical protein TSUD_230790 [Trifolium subterraneum]